MDGYEFLLHLIILVVVVVVLIDLTRVSSKSKIPQAIGGQIVDRHRNIVCRCADSQRLSPSWLPRTNALFSCNGLLQTPTESSSGTTQLQTKENSNPDLKEMRSFAGERSKSCAKDTLTLPGQKSSTNSIKIPTESSLDNAGPSNDEDRQNVENKSTIVAGIDENLEDPSIATEDTEDTPLVQDQQRVDISGNVDFDDIDHSVPVKDLIPTQANPLEDVPYPDCVILKRTHWEILKRSLEKMLRELSLPFEEEIDFGDSYDEKTQKSHGEFDEGDLIMDYVQNHFAPGNVDAEVRACPIPPFCEVCNHHEHDSICAGCGLHLYAPDHVHYSTTAGRTRLKKLLYKS